MRTPKTMPAAAALLGLAAFLPNLAGATLGEPETTAQSDSATLRGSIKSSTRAAYRVHEITLPSGTTVREYAVAGGKVFAVVWQGPTIPDLRQMLGTYFDAYTAGQAKHRSHTHLAIENQDFVASVSGHMRSFRGRAYLPQAVPTGVDIGELP